MISQIGPLSFPFFFFFFLWGLEESLVGAFFHLESAL